MKNMSDIKESNIICEYNKQALYCHGCLSSNRRLSALGEYDGIFQKICDYTFVTANMLICWECLAMLKKLEMIQARVFKTQSLMYSQFAVHKDIQINSLSNLKICSANQIIDVMYVELPDKEEKIDVYEEEKAEIHEKENKETDVKLAEVKEEIEEEHDDMNDDKEEIEDLPDNMNDDYDHNNIKKEMTESVKKEVKPQSYKHISSKKFYKFVFDIKFEEFNKKCNTDFEQIKSWYARDRNSDLLKKFKFKCTDCLYIWKSKRPLIQHNRKFHSTSSGSYICDICSCCFKTKQHIINHMKMHMIEWDCAICGYKCPSLSLMKIHLESHKNEVQCLVCDKQFENVTMYREHYRDLHSSFVCDHCGKRCSLKHILERHMRNVHNFAKVECKHCKKRYTNKYSLRAHMLLRHEAPTSAELAYCAPCNIQFDTQAQYHQHVKHSTKHAAERAKSKPKVPCPECTNVYSRKCYMMNHYRYVHMKRTKYYCSLCDKYYLNNTKYVEHKKLTHEGGNKVKNKMCTICGRGFSENTILIKHMRTHTGERPFECPHCSSCFTQKYAMMTHVKNIHGPKKGKR